MTDTERERITAICEVAGVTEIDDLSDGFQFSARIKQKKKRLRQHIDIA